MSLTPSLGIASVFVSFPATLVIMAVSQTFGVGGASVIARALGAERHDEASAALGTIMTSGLFCALAMTAALHPELAGLYDEIYRRGRKDYWHRLRGEIKERCGRRGIKAAVFF